jgi:DnaJ-class molecular chaperone
MSLYEDLGVEDTASPEDIKRAFRKRAQKNHPDKGGDDATFQKIEQAYRILSDPIKRLQYDRTGSTRSFEKEDEDAIAKKELIAIFMSVVQSADPDRTDFRRAIQKVIETRRNQQRDSITGAKSATVTLKSVMHRLRRGKKPKSDSDYLRAACEETIKNFAAAIARCEELLSLLNRMEELLLSDYDPSPPKEQGMYPNPAQTFSSFLSGGR